MADTETTSAVTPADRRMADVQELLLSKRMQTQLRMALPRHITAERLARMALTQVKRTPKLLECSRNSFLGALMECAQLGLEPGVLGQAWIIPYKNVATLVVGYRGMVSLMWRSDQIRSIQAHVVYEEDHFAFAFGLEPRLIHEPATEGEEDPKRITAAYAVIQTRNGGTLFDVMSRRQIDAVRSRSRARDDGPWVTDYAEMAKKTVLKRLSKLAPQSVELQRAMAIEEQSDAGEVQAFSVDFSADVDAPPEKSPGETANERLKGKLDRRRGDAGGAGDFPPGAEDGGGDAPPAAAAEPQTGPVSPARPAAQQESICPDCGRGPGLGHAARCPSAGK